jgi:hypothetical protein
VLTPPGQVESPPSQSRASLNDEMPVGCNITLLENRCIMLGLRNSNSSLAMGRRTWNAHDLLRGPISDKREWRIVPYIALSGTSLKTTCLGTYPWLCLRPKAKNRGYPLYCAISNVYGIIKTKLFATGSALRPKVKVYVLPGCQDKISAYYSQSTFFLLLGRL